ncbi:SGNH/GDSL hydrolase family protein [Caulobacter sp. LARHSG274]
MTIAASAMVLLSLAPLGPAASAGPRASKPGPACGSAQGAGRILFVGDSVAGAAGAGGFANGFPARTLALLGTSQARSLAEGSEISAHPGKRSDQIEPLVRTLLASGRFDTIVFEEGINDAWQGQLVEQYAASMTAQLGLARDAGARIVVLTIPPTHDSARSTPARDQALARMNDWLKQAAPAFGDLVDVTRPLVGGASGRMADAFNSGDDIHPNAAGHEVIATALAAELARCGA